MSSSLRRGALAAIALALPIASLAACGAGPEAQSLNIRPDNAAARIGDIRVQNVNIVTAEEGSGPATVTAHIFNGGSKDEKLESITVTGSGRTVELSPAEGEDLTIPAGGSLALGGEDNASALIADAEQAGIRSGNAQPVVFEFSSTGRVELRATVVPAVHSWEGYGPSTAPTPTAEPSASEPSEPGASQSPGPDASASESGEPAPDADEGANDSGTGTDAEEGVGSEHDEHGEADEHAGH
ncbi:MAG TPA: DUF461 domain-containing protein [Streptomyces sp.]|uniref:DUF461 domain-containing protein n=1 Tax=Streptomyces sp. TaxID=1931 RepID=UPI002D7246AA|nr:DUF461 domain-containing protein [Streptomyces sp.]HZG03282.1 DUF461 domain-containing protein [Streptomyces sp.]